MTSEKIFDVAISCAEEDIAIAQQISKCLADTHISCYLYTDYAGLDWGHDIFRVSIERYGINAKIVLVIISSSYIKKYWSGIELQVAQTFNKHADGTLLPLRLDDSKVEGLSPNIVFIKWKGNPEEIAKLIKRRVDSTSQNKNAVQTRTLINNAGRDIINVKGNGNNVNTNNS